MAMMMGTSMSKTSSMIAMPTMINNVLTVIITVDITIVEIFMGGTATTQTMTTAALPTGAMHTVMVGGDNDVYTPNSVIAAVGDIVEFVFLADNHTISQSTFDSPCVKAIVGIDSGFMANMGGMLSAPPTFKIQVTTTAALFFFCEQMGHCGEGMVFTINPTANMTQAMFMSKAQALNGTKTSTTMAMAPTTLHTTTSMPTSMPTPSLVQGTGTIVNGMCECACLCGVNAYPAGDGIGSFGGLSGMAFQALINSVAMGMPTSTPLT
ncbi:hypothetical protein MMC13_001724 [Lambiella insularis]|nr:hypothetical protein [Lambiella insularis]